VVEPLDVFLPQGRRKDAPTRKPAPTWVLLHVIVSAMVSLLCLAPRPASSQSLPGGVPPSVGLPLRAARAAHFRVTEGTWVSLDVSPDGRTIIFDLLGDLYTLSITGGEAVQLTSGMAINREPRYSRDGRRIVFVSDRGGSENVWIADRDGRHARQLSNLHGEDGNGAVASPTWSPDGRTVVVSQRMGATRPGTGLWGWRWLLAAYDVETGHMRWISDTTGDRVRSALGATFGPDGRTIYAAVEGSFRGVPWRDLANWQIARVDLQTGSIEPEMGWDAGRDGIRPLLSPDGHYLVYATNSGSGMGLRLHDLRTDQERWIVREVLEPCPPSARSASRDLMPGYAFAPDGKSLLIAYAGKIHRINLNTGHTRTIRFVANVDRPLGPLTVYQFRLPDTAVRTHAVMQPALSPNGEQVAFSALDKIWVMALPHHGRPAETPRRLTQDSAIGEFYPSWSPDGRWIAYSTWVDGEGGAIRRVDVMGDTSGRTPLSERLTSDTAVYFNTAITRDGKRVAAVRAPLSPDRMLKPITDRAPFDLALVWVSAAGGASRIVTSLATVRSRYLYPVAQLYFTDDPNDVYVGLRAWHWSGASAGVVAVTSGDPTAALGDLIDVTGELSPDSRRAVMARRYAVFEVTLPELQRGKTDTLNLDQALAAPPGASAGAARRWGTALAPWISWSRNGRRMLFSQGGTLFVGEVGEDRWTSITRVDVPLQVPVDVPHGTLVLHGARIITMRGREVIDRGDLVVGDNRILAVGPMGRVQFPTNARVLDVRGMTIIPGYVDVHDHMPLAKGVHPQQWWASLLRLSFGVTTVRDPEPGQDNDVFTYQERERAGDFLAPRIFSTGIAYYGTDPPIRALDDARERVRPNAELFASETFKIYYDHATDRRARQFLAMATAEQHLNATAHINGIDNALVGVVDGLSGIEHQIPIRIYDDVASLIGRSGTTHTQTYGSELYGSLNYMTRRFGLPLEWGQVRRFVPPSTQALACSAGCTAADQPAYGPPELGNLLHLVSSAARIVARGGRVAIASHGNIPGLGFHYEMWLHALGGMKNFDILRSATLVGATAIGHAQDLGTLEPGKLADLQVLSQNPLDDIHHTTSICLIMKNGRVYQAGRLSEIWPRHQALAARYLWNDTLATTQGLNESTSDCLLGRGRGGGR
jgi:Tol biopolymer transport system component